MKPQADNLIELPSPASQRHRMRRGQMRRDIVVPYRPGWAPRARLWSDRLTRGVLMMVAMIAIVNIMRWAAIL